MISIRVSSIVLFSFFVASDVDAATLRVASWNMANHPNDATDLSDLTTVLTYAGATKPIDLLAMVETDTDSGPQTATTFGKAYGGSFASLMTAPDGGGDRTGFVYNTATLSLVSQVTVGGITHPSLRAQFRPLGTTGSDDFYAYAVHLQSGSTSAIKNQRVSQAGVLRANADTLGPANTIFGGDFNWQKADDVSVGVGAYRTFASAGTGQVTDAANAVGDWHANPAFKSLLTNDPGSNMDDRFDMQLISNGLHDGRYLDYVNGSFGVVGNDGTYTAGKAITTGSGAPSSVLAALAEFSDHLPTLADYAYRIAGDTDGDDDVDFNDFLTLQNHFGRVGTGFNDGDFDYSGTVDFNDFLTLQNNFGRSLGGMVSALNRDQALAMSSFAATVPEPSAAAFVMGVTAWVASRRRR